ncbi:hypothetical protein VH569_34070 [Azospirillum sp. 11R-A]|uniref:hypothetical protein n=1 Tax=Azospirillum sp. 11R-A TaxID=3111634 RepID=UPI003C131B8E
MKRGLCLGFVLLCWMSSAAAQIVVGTTTNQTTEGWCAPATANVAGNVTITCHRVDPRAVMRLNELLDKKDLELQDKVHVTIQRAFAGVAPEAHRRQLVKFLNSLGDFYRERNRMDQADARYREARALQGD